MSTFTPSPGEQALVSQIFAQSDPQNLGYLTGDVAVRIFDGAKLPAKVLADIWAIADEDESGRLPRRGVTIALRLIGWAQKGEPVARKLINKPGPLPVIEGFNAVARQATGASAPKSPPPLAFPPLTAQDRIKYLGLFQKSGPEDGLLSGEKARDIFVKSQLSTEQLSDIWNLADTKNRGMLDQADFAIAMYFIQGLMQKRLSFIPSSLPPGLYQQASGVAYQSTPSLGGIASHPTGTSGSFSPVASAFPQNRPLQQQYTGQSQTLQPDYTGLSNSHSRQPPRIPSRPLAAAEVGSLAFGSMNGVVQPPWDVSAADKATYDQFFATIDKDKKGIVDGAVVVPFMMQSGLPSDDLARIWDLADIREEGHLTRDTFAVAMHLITQKLAKKDLPAALPLSLIPPSMRQPAAARSPFSSTASAFTTPAFQPPAPEPERDLLWDETPPPTATPQAPQSTGPGSLSQQPTGSQARPFAASPPVLSQNITGSLAQDPFGGSPFTPAAASAVHKDLLSDDDDVARSPPLHDQSAEIGNVRNQLSSTTRSLDTAKAERAKLEQTVANQTAELSSMQGQLAVVKASYDHETNLLSSLRERFAAQAADIQKTREELIRAESDLSAVRLEKAELEGNFLRDKEEVRALNRKMGETTKETEALKAEVEKAKKEAKQQKGLLAIARKQLSAKEAERAKAEKERDEAEAERATATGEREEAESELQKAVSAALPMSPPVPFRQDSVTAAAAHELPSSPGGSSPSLAMSPTAKSTNPFERRLMGSGNSTPRSQSPFMPFANAPVPTPTAPLPNGAAAPVPAPAAAHEDDPFGFNQVAAEPASPDPSAQSPLTTPVPAAPQPFVPPPEEAFAESADIISPTTGESEHFSTPPSTASGLPHARSPTEDELSTKFPAIDAHIPGSFPVSPAAPAAAAPPQPEATDLSHNLKELDVPESDSDSDEDEDEIPLAQLAQSKGSSPAKVEAAEPAHAPPNGDVTAKSTREPSFDDVFGVPAAAPGAAAAPAPATSSTAPAPVDFFGATSSSAKPSSTDPFGFDTASNPAPVASNSLPPAVGVDVFDAALGRIASPPPGAAQSAAQSAFDSAFDDNFDFAAASDGAVTFQPEQKAANGHEPAPAAQAQVGGFDDVFGTGPAQTQPPPAKQPPPSTSFDDVFGTSGDSTAPSSLATSAFTVVPTDLSQSTTSSNGATAAKNFDETFATFNSTPSLNLDTSFTSVSTPVKASVAPSGSLASPTQAPQSKPVLPSRSSPEYVRASSPAPTSPSSHHKSPPPRTASPKPRPSTSSASNHTLDKPKETPQRHSKLSIRLPFGKKKKQEAPPAPAPSSFLTPPAEEATRNATPAVEDDAEPVKQLCGMGFSRTDAIAALEKHGYDVQRALNSLLGAP